MISSLPLVFLALTLTGWVMLAWAAGCAPEGIEDEAGFHIVNPGLQSDTKTQDDVATSAFLRSVLDHEFTPAV